MKNKKRPAINIVDEIKLVNGVFGRLYGGSKYNAAKNDRKPSGASERLSEASDERIEYKLTPLGVSVVERGRQIGVFTSAKTFKGYLRAVNKANKAIENGLKKAKIEQSGNCQLEISGFDDPDIA